MPATSESTVRLDQLLLDPNNYRFQDYADFSYANPNRFHEETVQNRAFKRLKDENLQQLKGSILRNGYLAIDKLVVAPYVGKEDSFVVIDGNRRTAALKWIKEDHESGVDVPAAVLAAMDSIPVLVTDEAADPLFRFSLMGIRHVSGVKEWGGYQRAKIVGELKDKHEISSAEIAERLGMTAHEVNRRYRAFKALDQMQNDEVYGSYAKPEMYPLFHEAISLSAVKDWLGWNEESAQFEKLAELEEFYKLLTPTSDDTDQTRPPKISTFQEVRDLRYILPNPEAKRVLLNPEQTLPEAIGISKQEAASKTWLNRVAAAIAALNSVPVHELTNLSLENLSEIRKLRDMAESTLKAYERLNPPTLDLKP